MNTLLLELAAGERDALLTDDAVHRRSLELLEWRTVLEMVAGFCRTRYAAERVRGRRPFGDLEPIALRHALADEIRPFLDSDDPPPLGEVSNVLDLLRQPQPWRFEGFDLVSTASAADGLANLRDWMLRRDKACPRWADGARQLASLAPLSAAVSRVLDRDGTLKDDASPELMRLRRRSRDLEGRLRDTMNRMLADARSRGLVNGPEVTLRGDRFCLPLHASARRRVEGIIHDRSASGATLFVEPAAVVDRQNDLVECRLDAAAEIERLILALNAQVEAAAPDIREAAAFLLSLDEITASVRWSREVKGVRPELGFGRLPALSQARHPLLPGMSEGSDSIVPLDLVWPDACRAVVVSGPNAGGKSVALKGVGVHILLAQCGWDVPAAPGTALPLVTKLCVDLGDDQSIARSLSSFSAHLDHLGRFLADADENTLILCDEIGSGTDPDEGTSLAFAVLEELVDRGALVLASTHYGLLKAAVDDHPAMINAAMDFDELTLQPSFHLRLGVPGASHAFDIAGRMGLPRELLTRARERLGEDRFRIERLLTELGRRASELATAQQDLDHQVAAAERDAHSLRERLDGIAEERRRITDETRREGEALLREARRDLEQVVREIRSSGADDKTIRYGRDTLSRLRESIPAAAASAATELVVGDRVRIPHLGLTGVVMEIRGEKITADARGMRLSLSRDSVEPATGEGDSPPMSTAPPPAGSGWSWQADDGPALHEIDVRGYRAEDGWDAVDQLLDRVIPAGIDQVSVIHGVGTGRLRTYLHERLSADPRVAGFADAPADRGGSGRTFIRLDPSC